jgi:hypothetical protein
MYRTMHKLRRDQALDLLLTLKKTLIGSGLQAEDYVLVFPWGNFGEHTYTLGFLRLLRSRYKIGLVLKDSKMWMHKYFPDAADFVIHIPDMYQDLYEELLEISSLTPGCPYVVWTDVIGNGRLNTELVRQGRITLAESYAFALELPLNAELKPLSIAHAPELAANRQSMQQRGTGHALIMPAATTARPLAPEFWYGIYDHLDRHGLNPILDSTFIDWDTRDMRTVKLKQDELINFVAQDCRSVIGLRSGMMDLLGGLTRDLDLRLAALYPVEEATYSLTGTGLNVQGVANTGLAVGRCWNSDRILDVETGPQFAPDGFGNTLAQFLRQDLPG